MNNSFRIALLVTATLATVPAFAQDTFGPKTRQVSLEGLDLASPAGVAMGYRRIKVAAHAVCQDFADRGLAHRNLWQTCVSEAIGRAITDVHAPALTAYSMEKTRKGDKAATVADIAQPLNQTSGT